MDIIERIDHWAEISPGRIAHVSGGSMLTWGDLKRKSDTLAGHFRATLPNDRSPVAIQGHKEPEMLIGFLGALKAGYPYMPLDVSIPDERVKRYLAGAGACRKLGVEEIAKLANQPAPFSVRPKLPPEAPVYILFTSGSTGEPKGVEITAECLAHFVDWLLEEQQFATQGEIFLNQAPFSFDLSVMDLYGALLTGGTLFSLDADIMADYDALLDAYAKSGVTVWVSTPSFARMSAFSPGFNKDTLPALKKFLFCGETLSPALAADLLERFPGVELWNTYGPTEATVAMTSIRIDPEMAASGKALPVGHPMPGTDVLILNEAGKSVAAGKSGEIVILGPNVSPGYVGRPDLTAQVFLKLNGRRGYRTGDIGRMSKGVLYCEGRRDNQVKIRGFRVELGEIDAALSEHPRVREAVTILRENGGEELAAYIVPAGPVNGREVRAFLSERLPAHMVPAHVTSLEMLPLTANGKLDRKRLPAPTAQRVASQASEAMPLNRMQLGLIDIWERVLKISPVGIKENFFELGGHSLRAAEMIANVEQAMGKSVPLREFFEAPTIEHLARILERDTVYKWASRPPFFCLPALLNMVRELEPNQPYYGLNFPPTSVMAKAETTIEGIATDFVRQILAIQNTGPYYLGGFSFGGVVAFEIARQLTDEHNEEVALLALLDPDPPKPYATSAATQVQRYTFHLRNLARLNFAGKIHYLAESLRKETIRRVPKLFAEDDPLVQSQTFANVTEAVHAKYEPREYRGSITLILARDTQWRQSLMDDPRFAWKNHVTGRVEVYEVPGNHFELREEPYVRTLAERLASCLAAAAQPNEAAARKD